MKKTSPLTPEQKAEIVAKRNALRKLQETDAMLTASYAFGNLEVLLRAAVIFNYHEGKLWLLDRKENEKWEDYCTRKGYAGRTADRYLRISRAMFKELENNGVPELGKDFLFSASVLRDNFKDAIDGRRFNVHELAEASANSQIFFNYIHADQTSLTGKDALLLLRNASATDEPPATESLPLVIIDPFFRAYAEKHGLRYDKSRGWLNSDGSDLSEKQRIDIVNVQNAATCPDEIARIIAKALKEIEHAIKRNGDPFQLTLMSENKPAKDLIFYRLKEANIGSERLSSLINRMYDGDVEAAMRDLTSSAEEFEGILIEPPKKN